VRISIPQTKNFAEIFINLSSKTKRQQSTLHIILYQCFRRIRQTTGLGFAGTADNVSSNPSVKVTLKSRIKVSFGTFTVLALRGSL
jgi:hypothetical protein